MKKCNLVTRENVPEMADHIRETALIDYSGKTLMSEIHSKYSTKGWIDSFVILYQWAINNDYEFDDTIIDKHNSE